MVENGQAVCKLTFERMLEEPTALYGSGIGSSYQQQEETLSRYFSISPRLSGVPQEGAHRGNVCLSGTATYPSGSRAVLRETKIAYFGRHIGRNRSCCLQPA